MAAFLKFAPAHGVLTATETIAQLNRGVSAVLRQHAHGRPKLVCNWQHDADGRLTCHWEFEPPDIPVPPD